MSYGQKLRASHRRYRNCFEQREHYSYRNGDTELKKEFPEIKGTSNAFDLAAQNGHNDILMLLKKEFPELRVD